MLCSDCWLLWWHAVIDWANMKLNTVNKKAPVARASASVHLCVYAHLVQHLKLHQKLVALQRPNSHTAVLPTGGKMLLIWTANHTVHLQWEHKLQHSGQKWCYFKNHFSVRCGYISQLLIKAVVPCSYGRWSAVYWCCRSSWCTTGFLLSYPQSPCPWHHQTPHWPLSHPTVALVPAAPERFQSQNKWCSFNSFSQNQRYGN